MARSARDSGAETQAMPFDTVFQAEIAALRGAASVPSGASATAAADRLAEPLSALCLSGGGIRSAALALGVLQALARFGLLGRFDYLSTVSGGGYIGSFLSAWRRQQNDAAVAAGLDRTAHPTGAEAPEIARLRAYSNYLTPRRGVLSADTWTAAALVVRNLLLNWLVFLPFFMGLLILPYLGQDLLHTPPAWLRAVQAWLPAAGLACVTIGLAAASDARRRSPGGWMTDGGFVLAVLGPVMLGATCFTAAAGLAGPDGPAILATDAALAGAACYAGAWLLATVSLGVAGPRPRPQLWPALLDLLAWSAGGAVAGLVLGLGRDAGAGLAARDTWLVVLGGAWTMLAVFAGELVYVGLRSYARRGEMDREWLARAAGWLGAGAVTWSAFAAIALFGPPLLAVGWHAAAAGLAAIVSGGVSLGLGSSARTGATAALAAGRRRLSLTQLAELAAVVFAILLATGLSLLDGVLRTLATGPGGWLERRPLVADAGLALLLTAFSLGLSCLVNVNRFSLHALYRNRLVRAFLGAARAGARQADRFTGFDPADNTLLASLATTRPLHVINAALNVVATRNLAWQERRAEPFTFTPLAVGNPAVGYRPTADYGGAEGGVTLGTAMAISGAAVSPNMGYHSSPLLGFLLMLFNLRLGWWLGNPCRQQFRREGPPVGLWPMLLELSGQTTDRRNWVYLSDGGHFDNLGLYEMVRRRARVVVVSDAGCDPDCTLADLGDAVRKIYIDQGVSINFHRFDIAARKTPPQPGVSGAIGEIIYPDSAVPGWLLYLKPGYHGDEPPHVRSYAEAHKTFPHETTANQWFNESQFEAYRALGAHLMEHLCAGGATLPVTPLNLAQFRDRVEAVLAPAPPALRRAL